MRFAPLVAALPLFVAAASAPHPAKTCPNARPTIAHGRRSVRPQKLDQLPPAHQEIAIVHIVDGCERPIVVRDEVGGRGR